jgi:hypothetical protein
VHRQSACICRAGSREASPQRVVEGAGHRRVASSLETSPASSSSGSPQPPGGDDDEDDEDEEFIDTVEVRGLAVDFMYDLVLVMMIIGV